MPRRVLAEKQNSPASTDLNDAYLVDFDEAMRRQGMWQKIESEAITNAGSDLKNIDRNSKSTKHII